MFLNFLKVLLQHVVLDYNQLDEIDESFKASFLSSFSTKTENRFDRKKN